MDNIEKIDNNNEGDSDKKCLNYYYRNKDKVQAYNRAYFKNYYIQNKEKIKKKRIEYYLKNPDKFNKAYYSYKYRKKKAECPKIVKPLEINKVEIIEKPIKPTKPVISPKRKVNELYFEFDN